MIGVIIMSHGTPPTLADVEPFYTEIRRGRPPTAEQLADLVSRYEAIGGTSPLNELTARQVAGISSALDQIDPGRWIVAGGAKFASPRIEDAVGELLTAGVSEIVGIALAPHSSVVSTGEYERRAVAAIAGKVPFAMIDKWYDATGFAQLLAHRVRSALGRLGSVPGGTLVLFTAHSVPVRVVDAGDTYAQQVEDCAEEVAAICGLSDWSVAWQSAGRTPEPWLGPDLLGVIAHAPTTGAHAVVVCPIGFVSDHLEVLYDVDIEAKNAALAAGVAFERTESFNDDKEFTTIVAEVIAGQ